MTCKTAKAVKHGKTLQLMRVSIKGGRNTVRVFMSGQTGAFTAAHGLTIKSMAMALTSGLTAESTLVCGRITKCTEKAIWYGQMVAHMKVTLLLT